ncbi:MAG: hypothetical protein WCH78_13200 [Bacteroidota bacterium]
MKSRFILLFFVCLLVIQINAQSIGATNKAFDESYDASGKPFAKNPNSNVEGSELFNQNWGTGDVKMTRNKSFNNVELQFNIVTQQLLFKKEGTVFAFGDNVLSFTLNYDLNGKQQSVFFKNNYPACGNQTNTSFYQVIYEGKKHDLLKFLAKKKEERYEYNQPFKLVYTDETYWYYFDKSNFQMLLIKNNLNDLQKNYAANWQVINASFQPKNKKHLSDEEMLQFFKVLDN